MKSQMANRHLQITADLAKIKSAISDLSKVVNDIKSQLVIVEENTNQLDLNLPTVTTVNGTLYAKEAVFLEQIEENGDCRVKDTMGRIWFVKKENLK